MFTAFVSDCELSVDVINSHKCFNVQYALSCQNIQDSSFVYDCRNCSNCLFCSNLRNKHYCIGNKQLSKEQYQVERAKWNLLSRSVYEQAKQIFARMMREQAWHRSLSIDLSEECTGNFLQNAKGCQNCFFIDNSENCINCVRSVSSEDHACLDSLGHFGSELVYNSVIAQDSCYDVRCCFNVLECKEVQYSAYCFQCEHCFGCCGLKKKKFCIFNKQYQEEEYYSLRDTIIEHMHSTGEYGHFFPAVFAPISYDQSWSNVHFPLNREQQQQAGFRTAQNTQRQPDVSMQPTDHIPDDVRNTDESLHQQIFWDVANCKPLRIAKADVALCRQLGVPLPSTFYTQRLMENFQWMFYNGKNRQTTCARSGKPIQTNWPADYDGRIVCEQEYINIVA